MGTREVSWPRFVPRFILAGLVLLAGAALAYECRTVPAPARDHYVVTAVLAPGSSGNGEVAGGPEMPFEDETIIRICFGGDGRIRINGDDVAGYAAGGDHMVNVDCLRVNGEWVVTTIVRDPSGDCLVVESGRNLGAVDIGAWRATGDTVTSLIAP